MNMPTTRKGAGQPTVRPSARRRIAPLTGIRGVASVWVVAYHADWATRFYFGPAPTIGAGSVGTPILDRGYLGVDLFFVLSGFVLAMSYGARLSSPSVAAIKHFALGRAWRILPLHWVVMLLFAAFGVLLRGDWPTGSHGFKDWVLTFALVQNWINIPTFWNSPAWSLSAEWLAYLVFPAMAYVVWKVKNGLTIFATTLAALFTLLFAILATGKDMNGSLNVGLARCFCEFFAGMCLFKFTTFFKGCEKHGDSLLIVGAILIAITLVSKQFDTIAPFAFVAFVFASWADQKYTSMLLGNGLVDWLGEISFSLYIVHWLFLEVGVWIGMHAGQPVEGWRYYSIITALLAALPAAAFLNAVVEKPSHRIGQRMLRGERSG